MTYYYPNNFEEPQDGEPMPSNPERHGCVTAWLIFMLICNSIVALVYLYEAANSTPLLNLTPIELVVLALIGVLNVIFSIMMLSWKKIGFYGFIATAVIAFIINISIGISPVTCIIGLAGIAILYGILQIKQNGVSAWDYLK